MTLIFNPLRAVVVTYSHVQSQSSVVSEDRMEIDRRTDVQTDGGDCITPCANAIGNNINRPFIGRFHADVTVHVKVNCTSVQRVKDGVHAWQKNDILVSHHA